LTHYGIVKVVLFIRPSEAKPHLHLTASWQYPWWSYSFRLTG